MKTTFQALEQRRLGHRPAPAIPVERGRPARGLADSRASAEKAAILVVQQDVAAERNAGLAQPAHAEQQQQDADHELEEVQRYPVEQGAEGHHQQPERDQRRAGPDRREPPAAQGRDREHDRERLDDLDRRGGESGGSAGAATPQLAGSIAILVVFAT